MSSEEIPQFPTSTPLVFQDDTLRFSCSGDPGPKSSSSSAAVAPLAGFIDDRYFQQGAELRRPAYGGENSERPEPAESRRNWDGSPSSDDDDDDDDPDEDDEGEVGNFVDDVNKSSCIVNANYGDMKKNGNSENNGSGSSLNCGAGGNGNQQRNGSSLGTGSEVIIKDGKLVQSVSNARTGGASDGHQEGRLDQYPTSVTIAEHNGGLYYSQFARGAEGSSSAQKDVSAENSSGINGRKDKSSYPVEPEESLRKILSDPITGALMDDAMILSCGHSFGRGGIQHIVRMKACHTCSQSVSEDKIAPNFSLRVAVQAFRREEEALFYRSSKRKRDRFEQDKVGYGDPTYMDTPRSRGSQFPFAVADRVVIMGNKRTPERFVGREAVVTTQCLNGWYVVKTLDNAESVKLQYRSLAKVPDDHSRRNKMMANWLRPHNAK